MHTINKKQIQITIACEHTISATAVVEAENTQMAIQQIIDANASDTADKLHILKDTIEGTIAYVPNKIISVVATEIKPL